MIEVFYNGKKYDIEVKGNIRGKDIFKKFRLNEEEHLLIVNGKLMPLKDRIKDKSKVEILTVISGG